MVFPGGSDGDKSACNAEDPSFNTWVRESPWRNERLPTTVFLPGESHGQRILAGYKPWGCKDWDMTEQLTLSLTYIYI